MTDGKETEVAAIWNSENYNGNTAGEYIFTLETELPEHVSDIFGTLDGLSITVTVLPAADKTALETAIESANALKEEDLNLRFLDDVEKCLKCRRTYSR